LLARSLLLSMANSPTIERFVKKNGMSAGFARRFIPGETMEDTVSPVRALNASGMTVSLDYLGESTTRPEAAAEAVAYYLRLFRFIADNDLKANVSLKITQLGLDIDDALAYRNLASILQEAEKYNQFVRIDMESSAYTQRTLDLFIRLWPDHKNVGVVLQSYLYRTEKDCERMIEMGARVRLCKGAYKESSDVAFPAKSDVDTNYLKLMRLLLKQGNYPGIATHDDAMINGTRDFARVEGISADRYEYQMLFGIRRDLQVKLVQEGYRMRIYVPFGTQWYAYMMRRLAERPANLWFVLKNLLRR
jgi:proline dehydrogenase